MKGLRGILALLMLLVWGPASIAGTYALGQPCAKCTQQEKQDDKAAKEFKFSNASQPSANHLQIPQADPADLPYLPGEFAFACPTLLGRSLPAHSRGQGSYLQEGFFSRLLIGSISAQAP